MKEVASFAVPAVFHGAVRAVNPEPACSHSWDVTPREAVALQRELSGRVRLEPLPTRFEVLGAADIGYVAAANRLAAVMVTFRWPDLELLETAQCVAAIEFPYVPGLLSFREVPPLLKAFEALRRKPDVILCDGQGIAHPRKLGLASHLGLCLDLPTLGCAKKRLCGEHKPFPLIQGQHRQLLLHGEPVGYVYCSRTGVKPIYISPGHKSDAQTGLQLVRRCLGRYRIPEPLRRAHHLATQLRAHITQLKEISASSP